MNTTDKYVDSNFGALLYQRLFKNKEGLIGFIILAVILLVVLPMFLSTFRLNNVGKYLCYAYVALGLVLCWGHAGIWVGKGCSSGLWILHGDVLKA